MSALLTATGLVKRFRGLTAVDNVSFSVEEGEVFAIIGPNGAGKTTLSISSPAYSRPTRAK